MKWASSISEDEDLKTATQAACAEIKKQLGKRKPDLVFVFVSAQHKSHWDKLPQWIQSALSPTCLIGCSAGGVVGGGEEIERRLSLAITAAVLPDVKISPIHFKNDALPTLKSDKKIWERLMGVSFSENPQFLLLPDPFSFDLPILLSGLDFSFPWSKKLGGMASGGQEPGENLLILNDKIYHEGLVGVALSGNIIMDALVAQGCRPIAQSMIITDCAANQIESIDGKPPFEVLKKIYEELSFEDQHLFKTALFVGLGMREEQQDYQKGDFLIRNIIGVNPEGGALAVGAVPKKGQVLQFHVRDSETSSRDLEMMLEDYSENLGTAQSQGALLFSCLGRGFHLYGKPNHDSELFQKHLGPIPLGGFFCSGEIGPVHGKTYLHGYTSSFGIFRARRS